MSKEIQKFCYKYEAVVGPSSKKWRRPARVDYQIWRDSDPSMFQTMKYEELPMVDITMPEDRFRALLEHDDWVSKAGLQDNNFFNNNVMRVSNLIVEHERECRIRQENPTVKLAWEKYQMLLNTVKDYYK